MGTEINAYCTQCQAPAEQTTRRKHVHYFKCRVDPEHTGAASVGDSGVQAEFDGPEDASPLVFTLGAVPEAIEDWEPEDDPEDDPEDEPESEGDGEGEEDNPEDESELESGD